MCVKSDFSKLGPTESLTGIRQRQNCFVIQNGILLKFCEQSISVHKQMYFEMMGREEILNENMTYLNGLMLDY